MNNDSLQTSFWVMVLVQTIGSVDMPGRGDRKMPAPRQYVAIVITWLVLQFIASIGANAQRAVTAISWVIVLAGMVVGPFGQLAVNFFNTVATQFAPQDSAVGAAVDTAAQRANVPRSQVSALTPFPPSGVTLGP